MGCPRSQGQPIANWLCDPLLNSITRLVRVPFPGLIEMAAIETFRNGIDRDDSAQLRLKQGAGGTHTMRAVRP
jgi:hypothetical protein